RPGAARGRGSSSRSPRRLLIGKRRGARRTGPLKRFTEPVAVSSTAPAGFPAGPCGLPRTTLGGGFDLLPLRAPCTREPTAIGRVRQDPFRPEARKERHFSFTNRSGCYSDYTDGTGSSREIELPVPPSGVSGRSSRTSKARSRTTDARAVFSRLGREQ